MSEAAEHAGNPTITVLSPHLDDTVLSCWHLLESDAGIRVVNVFTGSPPPGITGWWDELTGATNAIERMRERREEDRRALALAGRSAVGLELLDAQYRNEEPLLPELVERLRAAVPARAVLCAPAAMTHHPDHMLVRDAALELARDGSSLALYADLPHAIEGGWPRWVTGEDAQPGLDVAAAWNEALGGAGLAPERLVPRVHTLDAQTRVRKLRALDAYETQRAALDEIGFVPLDDPRALTWEVSWAVPESALPPLAAIR